MRQFTKSPIKAETSAEMTARHYQEELEALKNIRKQVQALVDSIEDLHEAAYEEMELGALYEDALDALHYWPTNILRLEGSMDVYNGQ